MVLYGEKLLIFQILYQDKIVTKVFKRFDKHILLSEKMPPLVETDRGEYFLNYKKRNQNT